MRFEVNLFAAVVHSPYSIHHFQHLQAYLTSPRVRSLSYSGRNKVES